MVLYTDDVSSAGKYINKEIFQVGRLSSEGRPFEWMPLDNIKMNCKW